ncbi:hypothetical protein EDEG_03943 [Edhazardia aedis USNM 41457]|uniref:Uncharacterized protein n=1 Tax=Edhazardia aedis (strain USNM 41457) TaxID=1003232 RepID=J9D0S0_EDHAE|nr:hypothetical protein EDEG_03943 [Edhazardia aedis USNM 41457]|eukprot:EJW01471.1 hypothetical protein EDEG_03943 [Edhazardia aedis USNM 41457]
MCLYFYSFFPYFSLLHKFSIIIKPMTVHRNNVQEKGERSVVNKFSKNNIRNICSTNNNSSLPKHMNNINHSNNSSNIFSIYEKYLKYRSIPRECESGFIDFLKYIFTLFYARFWLKILFFFNVGFSKNIYLLN